VDAAVDVALGGEMDDGARSVRREQALDERPVADVAAHEDVACITVERAQVFGTRELPAMCGRWIATASRPRQPSFPRPPSATPELS
jgi:hypothetical protein